MESTSPDDLANHLLGRCLRREAVDGQALDNLVAQALDDQPERALAAGRALFTVLVERLGDLFEPPLSDCYGDLFTRVIPRVWPQLDAAGLRARYDRIRRPRRCEARNVRDVFVLSRVTLGADVAVTSVLLAAARAKFPEARLWLAGNRKNWELFARDERIRLLETPYGRADTLAGRLSIWPKLREMLHAPASIVIDPDSRLTQLGLLPVCEEESYFFFDSRSYGGDGDEPLSMLSARWAAETFGVPDVRPWVAPLPSELEGEITVSLGVGENTEKRVADPFEELLLHALARTGKSILLDKGLGAEESGRAERAAAAAAGHVQLYEGAFAPFADAVRRSRLYVGYDSAAQHVAAACSTPLITIFAGYPSIRMFHRWRPHGPGPIHVVRAEEYTLEQLLNLISQHLPR